ncbi:matrixin family metalloprotease, partial [Streptomyces sp. NPDC059352]|uniref:matrixin family metalloprotease n=1 Tax=Streptomyces sp. NPDC059352 TaxID=3346810 RepID=UPI0036C4E605
MTSVLAFPKISNVPTASVGEEVRGLERVQGFLTRFGYLADGYNVNVVDDSTSRALQKFQEFNGLPTTGEFDAKTRATMTQPRCALPDLIGGVEFATTCAWDHRNLTFAFEAGTSDAPGDEEFDAVRNALGTWSGSVTVTFTEVALDQDPDIVIGWRPANDPDHNMIGGVLAHADFPPGCGVVTNGNRPKPVHFDDTEHAWSIGAAADAFDVETVALHELGHILGLGHSSTSGAVMLPTVSPNMTKRALTADDIDGVRSLYPGGPGWAEVYSIASAGAAIPGAVTAHSRNSDHMDVFWVGPDGSVRGNWWH